MNNGSNGYRVFYLVLLVLTAWFFLETFMALEKISPEAGFFESFCDNCNTTVSATWTVEGYESYQRDENYISRRCKTCYEVTYSKGLCVLMLLILTLVILVLSYGVIIGRQFY